ncbi:hypothetical protein C8F04DRAFT_1128297 [Mycena alexandri]|uniref:Uncharacterized protein n=1 Tax=Mycena alexandri TaxID=1745969 RepID=A0AAD6WSJ1_9AGAR|nr:hypothetical protein C8F04DRAFT_1128297 [Mycena alexandri]
MVESESEPCETPFYGPAKGGWVTLTNPAPRARQQVERRPCAVSVPDKLVHHRPSYVPPKSRDKPREPFQTPPDELVTARDNTSDRWHVDRVVSVPRPTPLQVITIPFRPTHGPCTAGVSLSELLVCRGLTDPWKRLSAHIPNGLLVEPPGRMGRLVITVGPLGQVVFHACAWTVFLFFAVAGLPQYAAL